MRGSSEGLITIECTEKSSLRGIVFQMLHGQESVKSLNDMEFEFCGVLMSEIREGDVDVFVL